MSNESSNKQTVLVSGCGTSPGAFHAKHELMNQMMQDSNTYFAVIDPNREYKTLAEAINSSIEFVDS